MKELTFKKVITWLSFVAGGCILAYLLYVISEVLIIFILSILLAFIFQPFISILENKGLNRVTSILAAFALTAMIIYMAFSYLIPNLLVQMNQFVGMLQVIPLHDRIFSVEKEIHNYLPFFTLGELSKRFEEFISSGIMNSFDKISPLLSSIISIVILFVIVPFITFFILKDSKIIMRGLLQIVPNTYFEISYWIMKKVTIQLGKYARGWIFDATFVGIACGLGYYIVGVKNALPLGLISGLGHLVPYFGPIIGGVPAIVISLIQYGDFSHVPSILLMILIVYTIDNGLVQPYVFSKSVGMHPLVIIFLVLIGSQLFGVIGTLLAIPTATIVKTLSKEIYFAFKNYKIVNLDAK
ncbi:MAG: AI-2E family transporter [Ignavibacteriaceae bacterium]